MVTMVMYDQNVAAFCGVFSAARDLVGDALGGQSYEAGHRWGKMVALCPAINDLVVLNKMIHPFCLNFFL